MSDYDDDIELERFKREIPLAEYASSRGYQLDRRESSRSYVVMRKDEDKVVIKRGQQKDFWVYYNPHDDQDHGTIVDFVKRRTRLTLGAIRKELRPWLGEDRRRYIPRIFTPAAAPEHDRAAVAREYDQARETRGCSYLQGRGLRPETLSDERFRAMWREEADGKVIFPHRDREGLSGFERKGPRFTGFASGGQKSLWHSHCRAGDTRLVLVESAIDALSYHQLNPRPDTRYMSIGGAISPHQRELLEQAIAKMPAGATVVLAFDNDKAGQDLCTSVQQLAGSRCKVVREVPVHGKDWNELLKVKERDYIRSLARGPRPSQLGCER
jgi:hypothetical protein